MKVYKKQREIQDMMNNGTQEKNQRKESQKSSRFIVMTQNVNDKKMRKDKRRRPGELIRIYGEKGVGCHKGRLPEMLGGGDRESLGDIPSLRKS